MWLKSFPWCPLIIWKRGSLLSNSSSWWTLLVKISPIADSRSDITARGLIIPDNGMNNS